MLLKPMNAPALPDLESGPSAMSAGTCVTFKDLTFSLPSNQAKGSKIAYLLRGVSGFFTPGQLTALLGPSGSGKTTLLDVLSGRKTTGAIEGEVLYGGVKPTQAYLQRYTGFVEQFDTLISSLTVEEMLMYTAFLKRSVHESRESKQLAVDGLLDKLGLTTCKGLRIGDPLHKGISGGQAKRTNIGVALITSPRVLFLDEPTSGLDSHISNSVMHLLRTLADDGTSVCAAVHSPLAYAFKLFDSVMLLLRGEVVYFGPAGAPAITYAQTFWPDSKGSQERVSDAELLVGLVTDAEQQGQARALADTYNASQLNQDNLAQLDLIVTLATARHGAETSSSSSSSLQAGDSASAAPNFKELTIRRSTSTPWWSQLLTLFQYRTAYNYQSPAWLGPRIMDKLVFSVLILTLYLGIGDDFSPSNVTNLSAMLFMWCALPALSSASCVPSIVLERRLFIREREDGLYSVIVYLMFKFLEEIALAAVTSVIFSAATFYAIGFQGSFGTYWIVYYLTLCNGIVLAYLVAALSPNMDVANAALPSYVITLLFFAGQLMTYGAMPPWWKWYSYIDFLRYSWGALMVNQFQSQTATWTNNGSTVLQYYGLESVQSGSYIGYLTAFFLAYSLLAYLALSFVRHHKR